MPTLDMLEPARKLADPASSRVLSPKQAAEMLGISIPTLRRMWDRNEGPRKLKLSPRRLGVRLRDIDAYLASR